MKKTKKVVKKTKAKKKVKSSSALAESKFMSAMSDPAHAPGRNKMNLRDQIKKSGHKTKPQNDAALNHMSRSDRIKRTSVNRRVITGAAIGKTGQIVIK